MLVAGPARTNSVWRTTVAMGFRSGDPLSTSGGATSHVLEKKALWGTPGNMAYRIVVSTTEDRARLPLVDPHDMYLQ